MEKLTSEEIASRLAAMPDWSLKDKSIYRRFRLPTFRDAIAFVNRVADIAEEKNHHPFIDIDYRLVALTFTSWHAGGLTALDFAEAAECDALYDAMSAGSAGSES